MFDRSKVLSGIAAAAIAALSISTATAEDRFSFHTPGVIGAAYNDIGRADSAADVARQGGFATAGAVRWLSQAPEAEVEARLIHLPSVIGAMYEDRSLARSNDEVRRQGGFVTAGSVHWLAHAPEAKHHVVAAF